MNKKGKKHNLFFGKFRINPHIGVGKSLFLWFLAISLIPLGSVSYFYSINAYSGMTTIIEKSLVSASNLRVENINKYFDGVSNSMDVESMDPHNVDGLNVLNKEFSSSNTIDYKEFLKSNETAKYLDTELGRVKKVNHLDNIYLINKNGDIIFSLNEDLYSYTNIYNGHNSESKFTATARLASETGRTLFSDLEWYYEGDSNVYGFFCRNILERGERVGLLVYKTTTEKLDEVLMADAGMGESGVAYIIGQDLTLRSASRFETKNQILNLKMEHKKALEWVNTYEYRHIRLVEGIDNSPMEIISTYQEGFKGEWVYGIVRDVVSLKKMGVNWGLIEELGHEEVFAYPRILSKVAKLSLIITIIVVLIVALIVTSRFVSPIKKLSAWAKEVAEGKLVSRNIRAPNDEVGEMRDTFNNLVEYIKSVSEVAQLIAKGDYSETVKVRSENDVLAQSINQMIASFRGVVNQANTIANGDYSTNIVPRSEKDTLGIALYDMTKTLRDSSKELMDQDWLKTGLGQLNIRMSGKTDIQELSEEVVKFLVEYLDGQVGLIYLKDDDNYLNLVADYALFEMDEKFQRFAVGEGLIGNVAQTGVFKEIKGDNLGIPTINDGISNNSPGHVLIAPFVYEQRLVGVFVIGARYEFDDLQKQLFETTLSTISVSTNAAQANTRLKELFGETQEQKEKLQVQQEELRQTNEELEEQTRALKQSEEKLQSQKEELSVINEELEERSNALERERDKLNIANDQLNTARKDIEIKAVDLERASKYKSEFLANMSHELRTPLNSILVLSQIMATNPKGNLEGKQIQFAETINSSGHDLLNLINDILDLSKVESGKMELNIESLDIQSLLNQTVSLFKPVIDKKGLNYTVKIEKDVPNQIKTDPQRVFQVIKNLLSNAIKFTESGSIQVKVHRPTEDTKLSNPKIIKNKAVGISVIDTGIGIPKDKLKLIFDAFQQADGTTSRRYGGTGLGLSITRTFSEILSGEVQVESIEGRGTTFTLYLPEAIEEKSYVSIEDSHNITVIEREAPLAPAILQREEISYQDDRDSIQKGDKFVLIIEDDKNFSKVLFDLATDEGFKCLIAASGETGLHFTEKFAPSAIILDVGLPGIDGWEVMDRLKSNPKTRHIPVYFISAMDKNLEAMKMGAVGFITKPVSIDKLNKVFTKLKDLIYRETRRLLVIDDELIVRKSVVNLIGKEGVEIVDVDKGADALKLMREEHFDCVILDLGLEDVSGFDILAKIREDEKLKELPVIIYTGQELSHEQEVKLKRMADSIILKGAKSPERLLAETTLYLHRQESKIPRENQKMLHDVIKDKEAVYRGKNILIVDDDMRNVFALSSILESKKMKVIMAKNGREGIDKLNDNDDIDLVLMDIMMPEMDGYEAMKLIRKDSKFKKMPIIALTAKAMKDDREKCLAAGANEYLSKPIDIDKLLSMLRVWLYS